jgi:hypothetical protein
MSGYQMSRFFFMVWVVVASAATAAAQTPQKPVIAGTESLSALTLVKSTDDKAVVRFGQLPLQVLAVGDRVGTTEATVTTIATGRLVLEEVTTGADGKPRRAEIVIRDGQTGGKRFLRHPDLNAPVAQRPEVVEPARPDNARKPGGPRR